MPNKTIWCCNDCVAPLNSQHTQQVCGQLGQVNRERPQPTRWWIVLISLRNPIWISVCDKLTIWSTFTSISDESEGKTRSLKFSQWRHCRKINELRENRLINYFHINFVCFWHQFVFSLFALRMPFSKEKKTEFHLESWSIHDAATTKTGEKN